ncbi:MAG: right-handed parallel beta-helix repeat-containing protein, partial [bacterium]
MLFILGASGLPGFLLPGRALALEFHVSSSTGDDARAPLHAQSPTLPWRTIQHALNMVQSTGGPHTIHVAAGTYIETLESAFAGITLRGAAGSLLTPPAGTTGLYIDHTDFVLENFTIQGGLHGIRADAADRLVVRECQVNGASQNGLHLSNSDDARIENSEFADQGSRGIFILGGRGAYLRNNLVTGNAEWGIEIDGGDAALAPPSAGHLVAFNTVSDNGSSATNGGIRFENATGEIRDNLVAGNMNKGIKVDSAPTLVHHNLLWNQAIPLDENSAAPPVVWATTAADPLLVGGHDYRVQAGSPALEAGSGPVSTRDISGSIQSDLSEDIGTADIGYHVAATPSAGLPTPGTAPSPTPTPSPVSGLEHFVDCASGDDSRDAASARNVGTPWATIRHAILAGGANHIVTVLDGNCTLSGEIEVDRDGVTIRAANAGAVTIIGANAANVFNIQADDILLEGFVIETSFRGVRAAHSDDAVILTGLVLRGLDIRPPTSGTIAVDAITIKNARFVTVENNRIRGAGSRAIQLRFTSDAYVRNNQITQGSATSDSFAI